jgi:pSer/pThr/pTyr-binding forkhead associated (FHA) protein
MAYLEVRRKDDPALTRRVPMDRPSVSIGRSSSNHLQLRDIAVSRCHCIVETSEDGVRIVDVGSQHGLRVNRVRCRDAPLVDGDRIKIGSYTLTFRAGDGARSNGQATVRPATAANVTAKSERRAEIARMRSELATLRAETAARDSAVTARLQTLADRTEELETERLELLLRAERAEHDHQRLVERLRDQRHAAPAPADDADDDMLPIEPIPLSAPATKHAEVAERPPWLPTVVVTATIVLLLVAWRTLG